MNKIVPHFWYDTQATQAGRFYKSVFPDASVSDETTLKDTPSGDAPTLTITIAGQEFMLLSAGPIFKKNPSISIRMDFNDKQELEKVWNQLSENGKVMMPLDSYPFSALYGWVQDKYDVSWQLMHNEDISTNHRLTPTLMFTEQQAGKAEEAIKFYTDIFKDSKIEQIDKYEEGEDPSNGIKYAGFTLEGQEFAAMDSGLDHGFTFNEGISLIVYCKDQDEIDYYWEKLSAVPEAEQCGWLKDKFGVSWQIIPTAMKDMMNENDPEKLDKVTQAFLKMKKFDIKELERAYNED